MTGYDFSHVGCGGQLEHRTTEWENGKPKQGVTFCKLCGCRTGEWVDGGVLLSEDTMSDLLVSVEGGSVVYYLEDWPA